MTHIDGVLSPQEADHLVKSAEREGFTRSEVGGHDGGPSKIRTSRTAYPASDAVTACLRKRLATLAGAPAQNVEELQVTRYARGQRYGTHHDDDAHPGEPKRLKTIFAYLNDLNDCGGSTIFPRLRDDRGAPLRVYPRKGSAVMWDNYTPDGRRNEYVRHGGEPVTCAGKKFGLNAWFLDGPEDLPPEEVTESRRSKPRTRLNRIARVSAPSGASKDN